MSNEIHIKPFLVFQLVTGSKLVGGGDVRSVLLSLRNVEDLLFEWDIDICQETVRLWWNRFGPLFATDIRRQCVSRMRRSRHWRWHVDELCVRINGARHYLWRAIDHEGEILESFVCK